MSEDFDRLLVRTSRDTLVVFAGNFLSTLFLALSAIVVARILLPENYGVYSVSLTASNVLLLLTDFGVDSALVKYVSKFKAVGRDDRVSEVVHRGLLLKLSIATTVSLVNYLFAGQLSAALTGRPELSEYVRLTAFLTFAITILNTSLAAFSALGRMKSRSFITVLQSLIKLCLSPLLVVIGLGVSGAIIGHVISYVLACVAGVVMLFRYVGPAGRRERIVGALDLIKFGLPLYMSGLFTASLQRIQYVMLARVATNVELGNVQAANQFISLIGLTVTPFSITLFPAFSRLEARGGLSGIKSFFNKILKYMVIFTVHITLMISVFSTDVVRLIYGRSYTTAPYYLTLISLGYLYSPFSTSLSAMLSGLGRTKDLMYSSLLQFLVMLPASYVLIEILGPTGYVTALSVSGIPTLLYLLCTTSKLGVQADWRSVFNIYISSLCSVLLAALLYAPINNYIVRFFAETLTSLTLFMLLLAFTGGYTRDDNKFLSESFTPIPFIGKVIAALLYVEDRFLSLREKRFKERK
ncbi:MAG: flippase [Zestosphaera sp.]